MHPPIPSAPSAPFAPSADFAWAGARREGFWEGARGGTREREREGGERTSHPVEAPQGANQRPWMAYFHLRPSASCCSVAAVVEECGPIVGVWSVRWVEGREMRLVFLTAGPSSRGEGIGDSERDTLDLDACVRFVVCSIRCLRFLPGDLHFRPPSSSCA